MFNLFPLSIDHQLTDHNWIGSCPLCPLPSTYIFYQPVNDPPTNGRHEPILLIDASSPSRVYRSMFRCELDQWRNAFFSLWSHASLVLCSIAPSSLRCSDRPLGLPFRRFSAPMLLSDTQNYLNPYNHEHGGTTSSFVVPYFLDSSLISYPAPFHLT